VDHKAEQQLMTREWRTPVRHVGDRRDGDGGSQACKRFQAVVRDAQGDARGGGEAGEMRAIPRSPALTVILNVACSQRRRA